MPRQYYSDKYIKHMRGAEKAEDNLELRSALGAQAVSEEREARRRRCKEAISEARRARMTRFDGARRAP